MPDQDAVQDITLAVLGQRLDGVAHTLADVVTKLDTLTATTSATSTALAVLQVERAALEDRVKHIESSNRWLVRTVAGVIIAAVVGLVIVNPV